VPKHRRVIMKIQDVPFCTVDWNNVTPSEYPGETGIALWRTLERGNIRVRIVEYTPGFEADHWCNRGHVLLVLEGELITELNDGRKFKLTPGTSFQVADDTSPHKTSTGKGAKVFIVD
jgi:quercetin dioxygenase-like cupin family protein